MSLSDAAQATTDIAANAANLNVARISGEQGASQSLTAGGTLNLADTAADRALAAVNALGAKWALSGTEVVFDTEAILPSGQLKLTATSAESYAGRKYGRGRSWTVGGFL